VSDRITVHALDAEKAVLGGVLVDNALFLEVSWLTPEAFFRPAHVPIWRSIRTLSEAREPIDRVTLTEQLRKAGALDEAGGPSYLLELIDGVPRATNVAHYAGLVQQKAHLRALAAAGRELTSQAEAEAEPPDVLLDEAQRTLLALTTNRGRRGLVKADVLVSEVNPKLEDIFNSKRPVLGTPTGFHDLDSMTRGMGAGNLILIAARPGMGKSSFAANVGANVAAAGLTVAFFSLEMTRDELTIRLLASHARMDLHKILSGWINQTEFSDLSDAMAAVGSVPLYIDDWPSPTLMDLRASCRRLMLQGSLALVVVDYLQLMPVSGRAENRNLAIGELSRGLKELAKELQVPIIALSQLSRAVESRGDKRPMLSDLRDSGNLEQDADMVWFLFREELYQSTPQNEGAAEIIIAKSRNGPTGTVHLHFKKAATRFENLARGAA
jgi:replicative DNA helicase